MTIFDIEYDILYLEKGDFSMNKKINNNIIENSYYMIYLFQKNDKEITNLKLQKLMYFVEAYYTSKNDCEELFDTEWSAWDYGPVNKDLYNYYKKFRSIPIILEDSEKEIAKNLCEENQKYINIVYDIFSVFTAFELVTLTHLDGSPWSKVYKENEKSEKYDFEELNNSIIPKEETKEWFKTKFDFMLEVGEIE